MARNHPADGRDAAVLVDVEDSIGTITLNRPESRNAVSWQLMVELVAALESLNDDAGVHVIVLTGAGRDFCVGADLRRVASADRHDQETRTLRGRSIDDDRERLSFASRATELLVDSPTPSIAKINGACAGAGLSLALATDITVASPEAMINTAFVSAGVSGDLGSAWLLARAVGHARARALLLDPVKMTAADASALGMVTEVTTDLEGRVHELAEKLSQQAPLAHRLVKENLRDAATCDLRSYLRAEVPRMVDSARGRRARQAAQAFIEPAASREGRSTT